VIGAVGASAAVAFLLDLSGVLSNGFLLMFLNLLVLLLAVITGTWWRRRHGLGGRPHARNEENGSNR
jgi:hypothetical protein